jgi:hypothetical protein
MTMRIVWVVGLLGLTACTPALVPRQSTFKQVEQMHCKQVTPTGSHLSKRICTTRSERDADAAQARAELEKAMDYQRSREMAEQYERQRVPSRP